MIIKNLFLSLSYAIMCSITTNIIMTNIDVVKSLIECGWVDSTGNMVRMGLYVFLILWLLSLSIATGLKSIWCMILFNYYLFFYNEKEIHVTVDDNRNISSYVELSNGKIIPIKIHKVVLNGDKDNTEPKEEESGE